MEKKAIVAISVVFMLFSFWAFPALGDVIYLKSGGEVEGRIIEESDEFLKVELISGIIVEFAQKNIEKIEKKETPLDEYKRRLEQVDENDAKALVDLALWCRDNHLIKEAQELAQKVVKIDKDNEAARSILGFVKIEGKWFKLGPRDIYLDGKVYSVEQALDNAQNLYGEGKPEQSIKFWEAVYRKLSESQKLSADRTMAKIYQTLGDLGRLTKSYQRLSITRLLPKNERIVYIYKVKILKKSRRGFIVLDGENRSLLKEGVMEEAIKAEGKVVLGQAYSKMKAVEVRSRSNPAEAKRIWNQVEEDSELIQALVPQEYSYFVSRLDSARSTIIENERRLIKKQAAVYKARFEQAEVASRKLHPDSFSYKVYISKFTGETIEFTPKGKREWKKNVDEYVESLRTQIYWLKKILSLAKKYPSILQEEANFARAKIQEIEIKISDWKKKRDIDAPR